MRRTDWGLVNLIGPRPDWMEHAACTPDIAEWFWPYMKQGQNRVKLSSQNQAALAVCGSCPVRMPCLQRELDNPQPHARIAGGRVLTARNEVM